MGSRGWPISRRRRRRRKFFLFTAIVITAAFFVLRQDNEKTVEVLREHVETQDTGELAPEFEETFKDPEPAACYYKQGTLHAEKGEYREALENYLKAAKINPNLKEELQSEISRLYYKRGYSRIEKEEYSQAEKDYEEAVRLDPAPEHSRFYFRKGASYSREGELKKAIGYYTITLLTDPGHAAAYLNRGASYRRKNEIGMAIRDYSKALEINPEYAIAYLNRGEAYGTTGEYKKAVSDFKLYLELAPDAAQTDEVRSLIAKLEAHMER